jgi:hypothetical protein
MKASKLGLALLTFAAFSFAQTGNIATLNFGSQSPLRQILPIGNMPPEVQVWIYDPPAGNDGYSVTLSYQLADGSQHVATQIVAGMGANTLVIFLVDAPTVASVKVLPMKFTGAAIQTP